MPSTEHQVSYSISEAADILCLSIPTLRMYEREGLVIPSRRPSGHRLYTDAQLERIRSYRRSMAHDKVTIAQLKHLLSLIPCWEINHCSEATKARCNSYPSREAPCWIVTQKFERPMCTGCLKCEVYTRSQDVSEVARMIAEHTPAGAP